MKNIFPLFLFFLFLDISLGAETTSDGRQKVDQLLAKVIPYKFGQLCDGWLAIENVFRHGKKEESQELERKLLALLKKEGTSEDVKFRVNEILRLFRSEIPVNSSTTKKEQVVNRAFLFFLARQGTPEGLQSLMKLELSPELKKERESSF